MTTVYFLGAGFSRGLGAPLFRDLFRSFPGGARVRGMNSDLADRIDSVLNVYRSRGVPLPTGAKGSLWRDPEEFIDVLESGAKSAGAARELIENVVGAGQVSKIVGLARRALAIECSFFLRGADPTTERWLPYLTWVRQLGQNDTIVSFNYDRVLELLKEKCPLDANHYTVVVPSNAAPSSIDDAWTMKCAPILKLHGSVDWFDGSNGIEVSADPDLALNCATGNEIVLAVPGPDKAGLRDKSTGFRLLWDTARDRVQQAGRIVFLGYRFPVTDAFARICFLAAIKEAIRRNTLNSIEIVLGPNEHHEDVERMKGLLASACEGSRVKIKVLPLYVEDYLSFSGVSPKS